MGWRKKWVDFVRVKEELDSSDGPPKRNPDNELWLNIRNSKHSAMPVLMWTLTAKQTRVYRVPSKSRQYAFAVGSHGKAVVYGCGISHTDTHAWMTAIRNKLVPPNKNPDQAVKEGLFEVSVIDTNYTTAADLQGAHGYLAVQPDRLTLLHARDCFVIQEWYLRTISRLSIRSAPLAADKGKLLVIQCDRESSTGEGEMLFFCPNAHQLLGLLHQVLLGRISGTNKLVDTTDGASESSALEYVDVRSLLAIRPERRVIEAAERAIAGGSPPLTLGIIPGESQEDINKVASAPPQTQTTNTHQDTTPVTPPSKPPRKSIISTSETNQCDETQNLETSTTTKCEIFEINQADKNGEPSTTGSKNSPEEEPIDLVEHIRNSQSLDKQLVIQNVTTNPVISTTETPTDPEVEAIMNLPEPTVDDILSTIDGIAAACEETEKQLQATEIVIKIDEVIDDKQTIEAHYQDTLERDAEGDVEKTENKDNHPTEENQNISNNITT